MNKFLYSTLEVSTRCFFNPYISLRLIVSSDYYRRKVTNHYSLWAVHKTKRQRGGGVGSWICQRWKLKSNYGFMYYSSIFVNSYCSPHSQKFKLKQWNEWFLMFSEVQWTLLSHGISHKNQVRSLPHNTNFQKSRILGAGHAQLLISKSLVVRAPLWDNSKISLGSTIFDFGIIQERLNVIYWPLHFEDSRVCRLVPE